MVSFGRIYTMLGETLYRITLIALLAAAAVTFALLTFVKAPYGKYVRKGWGPTINARSAWILMESPAVFVIILFYVTSDHTTPPAAVFLILWQIHYIYRTFFYPFLMRGGEKAFPVLLVMMALVFNTANGYLNGWFLFRGARILSTSWFADPRFIAGTTIFFAGLYIHITSDNILRNLREPGETNYRIPFGGFYRFLSAPNYFGEILQWCGWALLTWSSAGLAFATFTVANLLPRGIAYHRWYRNTFPDYPEERKAVIPFVL